MTTFTLADLETIIARRAQAAPEDSYTAKLLAKGLPHAAKKLGEEAVETVIAALAEDRAALTREAADLLFHLMVVLHGRSVAVQDVLDELAARQQQSGLAEKASRGAG